MLAVNSVLNYEADGEAPAQRIVILHMSDDGASGWSLDLANKKSLPVPFKREDFELHLDSGFCTIGTPNYAIEHGVLTKRQTDVRDDRWKAISAEVSDEPAVYDPVLRSSMYRSVAERGGYSLNTARSLFQIFWRSGKTKAALTPAFTARGAPGVVREPKGRKLGRPRGPEQVETGLNLNREQKRAIATIARAEFRRNGKLLLTTVYKAWLNRLFYCDGLDEKGKPARVPKPEYAKTGVPTLEQFKRLYYSLTDVIETKRIRSPREFALNYRPLTGTATAQTWGPGSRYLVDATMADIYLASRDNPNRIAGRPVIYIVIDVWSRLIVGLYVAIEDASWTSAMMALANAACSKVEFCAEHGIEIEESDWPAANIGARLLSDRGEVDSKIAENLVTHFNRTLEAAPAYRGDVKGLVETQFNTVQVQFGQHVPGYVVKKPERGSRDYRLDAVLDIHAFTATMIDLVLDRNSRTLKKYDKDQGMPGDVVPLTPIELWHWGMKHRSGRFQAWPEEVVRFRLMPTALATVDRNGISFMEHSYLCDGVRRLMTKARLGESQKVWISYDPRVTNAVYLHSEEAEFGFEVAALHDRSRSAAGRTFFEADQERLTTSTTAKNRRTSETTNSINVAERLKKRVAEGRARQSKPEGESKAAQLRGLRQNRAEEKARTKQKDGEKFRPGPMPEATTANVLPFPASKAPAPESYRERTLADFMGE